MNILLARHGETPWNREGRYQGPTDVPLSDEGEDQARALARRLQHVPIHRAIASPLSRARLTAELVLSGRGVELSFDAGLQEISHGAWEGRLLRELEVEDPGHFAAFRAGPTPDLPAGPGGESFRQVQQRAWAALTRATQGLTDDRTLLVVAHDGVNRALLCRVLGLPTERVWAFRQAPATLNVLCGPTLDALQVVRLNDADNVAPFFAEAVHRPV